MRNQQRIRWKLGALAGLAVALVTMIPQVSLWITRGQESHGAYAITDTDELVYSAYLNAIINKKPRRNDPFLPGAQTAAKHETYFSIQSLPPYVIGFVSRLFGISASTAFILLTPLRSEERRVGKECRSLGWCYHRT